MELTEALEKIRRALINKEFTIIIGLSEVFYEGRASSILGLGERVIMIKSDYSVLVHRPTGYEPTNWQPPNSKIDLKIDDNILIIEARRTNPSEVLTIKFHRVYDIFSQRLNDDADFSMYATEEDMKKAILADPSIIESGFKPIEEEKKLKPTGFIDVFGIDSTGRLTIIELKRRNATIEDIRQLVEYVKRVEREYGVKPRAIIVAPGVQRSAIREMKNNNVEFKCLTPRKSVEILGKKHGLDKYVGSE